MGTFKRINDNNYLVDEAAMLAIDVLILRHIDDLSVIPQKEFNGAITDMLYENMLSRYLAGLFIKEKPDIAQKEHHMLITTSVRGKNYNITLGTFSREDKLGYINGSTMV